MQQSYIFIYEAKVHSNGTIKGRVEATSSYDAQQKVTRNNLLVKSVTARVHKNQTLARKEKFEVLQ